MNTRSQTRNQSSSPVSAGMSTRNQSPSVSTGMLTRSQTRQLEQVFTKPQTRSMTRLSVNIDFDEASKAWMSNKRSVGNGQYKYTKF